MRSSVNLQPMLNAIKEMNKTPESKFDGVGWGKVKSVSPLVVTIEGNDISEAFLERSPFCFECKHKHKYFDSDTGEGASGSETRETEEYTIWRGLKAGDDVCVMRTNGSQKFIILWRRDQFAQEE